MRFFRICLSSVGFGVFQSTMFVRCLCAIDAAIPAGICPDPEGERRRETKFEKKWFHGRRLNRNKTASHHFTNLRWSAPAGRLSGANGATWNSTGLLHPDCLGADTCAAKRHVPGPVKKAADFIGPFPPAPNPV